MKPRVFIGSSSEHKHLAAAIQANLQDDQHTPTIWDQGIFELSKSALESLVAALDRSDGAVFVLAADDITKLRGQEVKTPRDNVVFELGLFLGRLGRARTFVVAPRDAELHLPSDFSGITFATYDPLREDGAWVAALGPACEQIKKELATGLAAHAAAAPRSTSTDALTSMSEYLDRALAMAHDDQGRIRRGVAPLKEVGGGISIAFGRTQITIDFGRIESCETADGSVVVLPATEFFDKECLTDSRTALGAFVPRAFRDLHEAGVLARIASRLQRMSSAIVERGSGRPGRSYGIGTCLYFDRIAANAAERIILVSTTTDRAGTGLQTQPHFLFAAMRNVAMITGEKRLTHVQMPLIGSGHGGLRNEAALMYLLLAIDAVLASPCSLRSVRIVIFQKDPNSPPAISKATVARILSLAWEICSTSSRQIDEIWSGLASPQ
jgi:hypothetical protein